MKIQIKIKTDWILTLIMLSIMLSGYPLIQAASRLAESHAMHGNGVAMTVGLSNLTAGFFP